MFTLYLLTACKLHTSLVKIVQHYAISLTQILMANSNHGCVCFLCWLNWMTFRRVALTHKEPRALRVSRKGFVVRITCKHKSYISARQLKNHDVHYQADSRVRGSGGVCPLLPAAGGWIPLPLGLRVGWELLHGNHRCYEEVGIPPVFQKQLMFLFF